VIPTLGRVFEELPAGVTFLRGSQHVFAYFNPIYQTLVGGRAVLGTALEQAFPELRAQGFMDRLEEVYRTGHTMVVIEAPLVLEGDGGSTNLFVNYTYQAIRDPQGVSEGILVMVFDVTEDVRARRAVEAIGRQQQQDRFLRAIDSMLDAVLIARPQRDDVGRIVDFVVDYVNKSAVAEYLRDDASVRGSLLTGVWPTIAELLGDLIAVVETGSPLSLDGFIHRHTSGDVVRETTLDIRASPLDGDLFLVWRDASERTRRDVELRVSEGRLVREQLAVHMLQQAILPRAMPDISGVDIAAEYLPAHSEFSVGGDWYDVFLAPDGRLAASVGDVAGKGLDAAQTMGQLRAAGRAAIMSGADTAGALSVQNSMMIHSGWTTFASAVIVMLDIATGHLEWCSAGHLPIVVVRSGVSRFLESKPQIVLGVVAEPGYSTHFDEIDVGDRFVLYTDGLVERRDEGLDVSLTRFLHAAPTTGAAREANVRMLAFQPIDAVHSDDVCILTVVRTTAAVELAEQT
jgi:PAS domain-containing protein